LEELVPYVLVNEEPLDRHAELPGELERPDHAARRGPLEIRGPIDDRRRIAPELEDHLLLAGPGLERPANGRAAGERQELEPLIADHLLADIAAHRHDADRALWRSRLDDDLAEPEERERRLRRGLQHDRVAGGHGRRKLVHGQPEWQVERADCRDRPDREAAGHAHPVARRWNQVERDDLAADPL
jgi:hypothetical protein